MSYRVAMRALRLAVLAPTLALALVAACGSDGATPLPTAPEDASSVEDAEAPDSGPVSGDAGAPVDAGAPRDAGASTPIRRACTETLGTALSNDYGYLDGRLVAIVPEGATKCNGDRTHVHLQILMGGAVYDVAVNTDGLTYELTAPTLGGPYREGWTIRPRLDYATDLGVRSGSFRTADGAALVRRLANVDRIRVYGIGYGPDGMHLVHRNGNGRDGALLLDPTAAASPYLLFRFADQAF